MVLSFIIQYPFAFAFVSEGSFIFVYSFISHVSVHYVSHEQGLPRVFVLFAKYTVRYLMKHSKF